MCCKWNSFLKKSDGYAVCGKMPGRVGYPLY
jgi:hypothetical protein